MDSKELVPIRMTEFNSEMKRELTPTRIIHMKEFHSERKPKLTPTRIIHMKEFNSERKPKLTPTRIIHMKEFNFERTPRSVKKKFIPRRLKPEDFEETSPANKPTAKSPRVTMKTAKKEL